MTIAALLSHSAGLLNLRSLRAASPLSGAGSHCLELQLDLHLQPTPTNWIQQTQAVCGTRLYNCLTSTCFLWALHLHQIQPVHRSRWYLRPDAPVSWLTARSKVNMLQMVKSWKKNCRCGIVSCCWQINKLSNIFYSVLTFLRTFSQIQLLFSNYICIYIYILEEFSWLQRLLHQNTLVSLGILSIECLRTN